MIDTYLVSSSEAALRDFCAFFTSVIGPVRGREETAEVPAVGDPAKWYACIRAPFTIDAQEEIEVCDTETGVAAVGVWA